MTAIEQAHWLGGSYVCDDCRRRLTAEEALNLWVGRGGVVRHFVADGTAHEAVRRVQPWEALPEWAR